MEDITSYLIHPTVMEKGVVRAWEETVMLPTYDIGKEEKNPMFLEKRVYQGSSGVVYPYPVVEKISDEKSDRPWKALFIENEFLKIMILPELGGRIQMAYDKVKGRHFVYYNQVIKPALVGLTGPWISGGIEFNWPQHHRPSTYLPTEYVIEENADGSVTVWCSEVERMFRTKGMQGFTLHPGKAYLEIRVKVYNRTSVPQTFLWWANPAVVVNDQYHSVFPPDVHAVFDHGKRDVSNFPIATGVYYKQDYSAGVDISKYKNLPVPTSYMAIKSKFDFVGGYEEGVRAGLLHVADHHVSPGKKQWTWGNGDFGQAWDRNLTDQDGPYIELMTGVYTDNQPDFTWLQPYEEKSWVQYFMPYSEVGYVKNASKDAIVNVEVCDGNATVILYTTSERSGLRVVLKDLGGKKYIDEKADVSPRDIYTKCVAVAPELMAEDLIFEVFDAAGESILGYRADSPEIKPMPDPAKAAMLPEDIASIEQLFLTGLHLEQYRHATYDPADYYLEALSRERGDVRCNNAMGLLLLRKGKFAEAEGYLRRAVDTLTERNPNPYDGEPFYNLGICLNMQERYDEAYDAFFKSGWNAAWQDPAYFSLAQIDVRKGNWNDALEKIDRSLIRNSHNHRARHLRMVILHKLGREGEAMTYADESLGIDRFNMGCIYEKYLITKEATYLNELTELFRNCVHTYLEYALDYSSAGLYAEAEKLLTVAADSENAYPVIYYAMGYFAAQDGRTSEAVEYIRQGAAALPDKCFPNRIEEVNILLLAMRLYPEDSFAPYYLGNFYYAARQYDDAVQYWEMSAGINKEFPTVLRNLALAYYNKYNDKDKAQSLIERAFELDRTDARIFMELDQLYKKRNVPHKERMAGLEDNRELTDQRDDLYVELVTLYNLTGEYDKARVLTAKRKFHPWEGGEGKITRQYEVTRIELAKRAMTESDFGQALRLLKETDRYPDNLGEGKLATVDENDINYYKGLAYLGLNDEGTAREYLLKATVGAAEPVQAFYYNDQQPDKIYFQGLAWRALGEEEKARGRFNKLIDHGRKHLFDDCRIDYFAVSMPDLAIWEDDLNERNRIHCYYVMGLGHLGLGEKEKALEYLRKVLELDINHPAHYFVNEIAG